MRFGTQKPLRKRIAEPVSVSTGSYLPQMFKDVAGSYTLFGRVDFMYAGISGAGKQHGAESSPITGNYSGMIELL